MRFLDYTYLQVLQSSWVGSQELKRFDCATRCRKVEQVRHVDDAADVSNVVLAEVESGQMNERLEQIS